MRVAQVKMNQDMNFGKREARREHMPSSERRAAHAIADSGHAIQRKPHGWLVFKKPDNLVLTIFGKKQTYKEVARQLALSV